MVILYVVSSNLRSISVLTDKFFHDPDSIVDIFITKDESVDGCHDGYSLLCEISLAISYVSHLYVLIFVQYQTISIAMTRPGSSENETTSLQIGILGEKEFQEGSVSKIHIRCK